MHEVVSSFLGDWWVYFRPAIEALLSGQNPYQTVTGLYNPVYAYWMLAPLRYIDNETFLAVVFGTFTIVAYFMLSLFLQKRLPGMLALMLNPFVVLLILRGNIDWLVWFGLALPFPLALIFFVIKPQLTLGLILYKTGQTLFREGILHTLKLFIPVSLALAASVLLYGLPTIPQPGHGCMHGSYALSAVLGVGLLVLAFYRGRLSYAVAAGPLLFPYACGYSLAPVMAAFDGWAALLALLGLYGYTLFATYGRSPF